MYRDSLILKGFHPDPSVIRVKGTFYVANSTFEWFPGVEIHESEDLLTWKLTGHVLTREEDLPMEGVLNGGGVWAPCLSYDGEYFYVIFSIQHTFDEFTQDTDNYVTRAADIHGPWSVPVYLNSGGFDASLFHDRDGRKWLLNMIWNENINENHFHGIELQEFDAAACRLIGERRRIYTGSERGLVEGPHLYHIGDWYYLLTAEGGTSEAHCVTVARSRSVCGSFENYPEPILTSHGHPELSIQYAGHGDIVEDERGNWYLFHLGARKSLFGGYSVLGRETFLQNLRWKDAWPILAEGNTPREYVEIPDVHRPGEDSVPDEFFREYTFDQEALPPQFLCRRKPLGERMSLTERPGYLTLYGRETLSSEFGTTMTAVRIQEPEFIASARVDYTPEDIRQRAGLLFYYHSANYYYLYIGFDDSENRRYLQLLQRDSRRTRLLPDARIWLRDCGEVELRGDFTPEGIAFSWKYAEDSRWRALPVDRQECPVTILSDEYANVCGEQGFTGAFTGIGTQDLTGGRRPAYFRSFQIRRRS